MQFWGHEVKFAPEEQTVCRKMEPGNLKDPLERPDL